MSVTNRWAVRDVATVSFFDLVTGNLKAKLNTLKMSGLENSASTVYSVGGSGNPKLVGFSGDRAAKFTLQDALFTNEVLGMLLGNDVSTPSTPVVTRNEDIVVLSDKATLTYSPSTTGKLISVNKLNADGTVGTPLKYKATSPSATEYSITGKEITLGTGSVADGEEIIVYYKTASSTDTKQIKATVDKFAGSYRLVLDVLVRDAFTKKDFCAQIDVPNAKIEDSWNMEFKPDGDPGVLDIPMEALKDPKSKDLYTMTIYDDEDLV